MSDKIILPGDLITFDFRINSNENSSFQKYNNYEVPNLKVLQWNIERGYKLDDILVILKSHNADIICLQELDISCERSNNRNCVLEIAKYLSMKIAFVVEFEEIKSNCRTKALQGGGFHGNAILSKYDFNPYVVKHKHIAFDWQEKGAQFGEPRKGNRIIIAADIIVPGFTTPIVCYCIHLEVINCGILDRAKQFADVLEDSYKRQTIDKYPYQMILGDLNTMSHGVARLVPYLCCDFLRFASIGFFEAEWWEKNILNVLQDGDKKNPNHNLIKSPYNNSVISTNDCLRLKNNHFYDPFCFRHDVTLVNVKGLFYGKLDWIFLRGFEVVDKGLDNMDYKYSDHKLLYAIISPSLFLSSNNDDPGIYSRKLYTDDKIIKIRKENNNDKMYYNKIKLFFLFVFIFIVYYYK